MVVDLPAHMSLRAISAKQSHFLANDEITSGQRPVIAMTNCGVSLRAFFARQSHFLANDEVAAGQRPALAMRAKQSLHKIKKSGLATYIKRRISLRASKLHREFTSQGRVLPDFLILGVQKGGTTSLFRYLEGHPNIQTVFKKEIKFFDCNYPKGLDWYRSHFPYSTEMSDPHAQSGEASPNYIFHPLAPQRVKEIVPNAKFILLLRDPVTRAYSHYHGNLQRGREKLTFMEAIEQEESRLEGEKERIIADPDYPMYRFLHFSYLARGGYIEQLRRWFSFFPREQILILRSEDFFEKPRSIFKQVLRFLDLPEWEPRDFPVYNNGRYGKMDPGISKRLRAYFQPYNDELYEFIGRDFSWENS